MRFEYPSELPVSAARDEIAEAVKSSQVVIVSGQTGSGKTTQLPKIVCLSWGAVQHGRQIVHTQPRRLAARTVAERIASEMGVTLGEEVGYQVRFTDESYAEDAPARRDGRYSAGADPTRSEAHAVRHDHHRRGA